MAVAQGGAREATLGNSSSGNVSGEQKPAGSVARTKPLPTEQLRSGPPVERIIAEDEEEIGTFSGTCRIREYENQEE